MGLWIPNRLHLQSSSFCRFARQIHHRRKHATSLEFDDTNGTGNFRLTPKSQLYFNFKYIINLHFQIRMLMKTHAFVRSTAPRFLPMDAEKNSYARALFPTVSMYLYFLFAPTLVYSDTYPRYLHVNSYAQDIFYCCLYTV